MPTTANFKKHMVLKFAVKSGRFKFYRNALRLYPVGANVSSVVFEIPFKKWYFIETLKINGRTELEIHEDLT